MENEIIKILVLIARPAAGKSELIQYLKDVSAETRKNRFHLGEIEEIDDFPMLWSWLEEDELLSDMGKPRLHTNEEGYFLWPYLWDLLIRRISRTYQKRLRDRSPRKAAVTTILEFARGKEQGGYRQAFLGLSPEILRQAAVLYINVSYQESVRKNRRRFNPDRPDSILEHGLTDEKMERLYAETDWHEFSQHRPSGVLKIQEISVPFAVFENEDDVTTRAGEELGDRLEVTLEVLWQLYQRINIERG